MTKKKVEAKKEIVFNVNTGLSTLEKVFDILDDLGIEFLLDPSNITDETIANTNMMSVFWKLFKGKKLREFLNLVTDNKIGNEDISGKVGQQIVKAFFFDTMNDWGVSNLGSLTSHLTKMNHKKANSTE